MPKKLTLSALVDKNKISSDVVWVFAAEIDVIDRRTNTHQEFLRICRNDTDLSINGNTYLATQLEVSIQENEGELPNVSLSIQDQSRTLMGYMQEYQGGLGFGVTLGVVPIPSEGLVGTAEPDLVESFTVIGANASSDGYSCSWQLGAENPLRISIPRRKQLRDRCSFDYKGPECRYSGGLPTCSRTLIGDNGCTAHGNTLNYGGFPGIVPR